MANINDQVVTTSAPITIDNIPSYRPQPKVSDDDIVYSSLLTSSTPVDTYKANKEEVLRTGTSQLVEQQITSWKTEQQEKQRLAVETILTDPSVPVKTRRDVALKYVSGDMPLQDLREKYLVKRATIDTAIDEADREAQDIYSESVLARENKKKAIAATETVETAKQSILSDLLEFAGQQQLQVAKGQKVMGETTASLASQIIMSIPAGYAGLYTSIKEQDPELAKTVVEEIQQSISSGVSIEEATAGVLEQIQKIGDIADTPFKWIGDVTLKTTDSPGAAAIAYTGTQAIGIVGGLGLAHYAIKKGKGYVHKGTPLDTTETANKEAAASMSVEVLKDQSGIVADAVKVDKTSLVNDYVLPKLEEEFGDIKPDVRDKLEKYDQELNKLYDDTEYHAAIAPVSQIIKDRDQYVKVLTETTEPHLLLSSSVIGTTGKAFGRTGTNREATISTQYNQLEGTAVYGRNAYHGYKTENGARNYMERLAEQTKHLPHVEEGRPDLSIIERDNQFYVKMDFKREYNQWEQLSFGADAISAHVISPRFDVTWFANTVVGDKIWPAYMRMAHWIPSVGATTAWKEARIEGKFINAQRDLFMGTKHPKDLVAMVRRGEQEGKVYSVEEFKAINQHLTSAENEQLHAEYVGFRRVQDHLYKFADRSYRKELKQSGFKTLYDKDGNRLGFVSEPLENLTNVKAVWDIEGKKVVPYTTDLKVVKMKESVRNGSDVFEYGILSPRHQTGEITAGALTYIPGYVPRYYKEWHVLDMTPKSLYVNGVKVPEKDLRNYKQAVAMGGTKKEIDALLERFQQENPDLTYSTRKEEKRIEDSIIHDSKVYETYLKEHHKRGNRLPALNREADVEDILVAQTKAIKGVSKVTAWKEIDNVFRKQFVKAYGEFTKGEFPGQINEILPKKRMTKEEEMKFLAAQKVYQQWEFQQLSTLASDEMWKSTMNHFADAWEKMEVDASVLREWGDKGFVPVRAIKALASNLFLYAKPARMWFLQPQQLKELSLVEPEFASHLKDIGPLVAGLLSNSGALLPLKSQVRSMGLRVTKEYDAMIAALEETGIMQSVDMNQMIHGIWRDSMKELDHSEVSLTKKYFEKMSVAAEAPFKIGRRIGYDPAELTNQISLWLFAKTRWQKQNPNKNWNTPENREQIAQLQSRIGHMASTRAGMYSWQEGTISMFTQFAAIPFKSSLQMLSSKDLSGADKAKLAAARLFWYGKYGIPAGAAAYTIMERNLEDEKDKVNLEKYSGGVTDIVYNNVLRQFDKEGEVTNVAASKSVSTVPDSLFVWDVVHDLYNVANSQPTSGKFPFMSAGSSVFTAVRGFYDLFTLPSETGDEVQWKEITWKAVSFAGQLSDYSKSQMAEQLTKSGSSLGYKQTTGEAIGRLIGLQPEAEIGIWEATKAKGEREKSIKSDAKEIHQRLMAFQKGKELSELDKQEQYIKGLQSFLSRVDESYRTEVIKAVLAEDRNSHKTVKESLMKYLYTKQQMQNDSYLIDMENKLLPLEQQDEDMKALMRDIRNNRSNK